MHVLAEFDDGYYDPFAVSFFRQNNFSSCKYFTSNGDFTIRKASGEGTNVPSGLLKSGCKGKQFLLSNSSGTIADAWKFCCSFGMTPAVISTLAEMTCVRDLFSNLAALEFYRVAAADVTLSRRFLAGDTQVPVALWARSEPDNYRGEEMCSAVHFAPYFGLYDVACFRSHKFLCSQDAAPIEKKPSFPYNNVIRKMKFKKCNEQVCKNTSNTNNNGTLPVPAQGVLLRCEGKTFFLSENTISFEQHLDSCCKMGGVPANIERKSEIDCLQKQFLSLPAENHDERSTTKFYVGAYDAFLNRTFYMCPALQVVPQEFWFEDEPNNGDFTQCYVSLDLGSGLGLHDTGLVPQRFACQFGPNITFLKDLKPTVPVAAEKSPTKKLAYNPNVYKLPMKDCNDFVCPKQKDLDQLDQNANEAVMKKGFSLECDDKIFFLSRPEVTITINQILPTCCKMGLIPARIESRSEIECLQKHFLTLVPANYKDSRPSNKFLVSGYDIYLNRTFYMCPARKAVSDDLWARGQPNNSDRAQCLITLDLGKNYGLSDSGFFPQRYICEMKNSKIDK